ncbi:FG-GAP-like repeat-containing protein [Paludisphaera borealis]|uniref:Beta-barrel assembly-enhancing protease n=1 Tax=Paludisphaera borealis TaxID=1387353 RepID=A0A1U7CIV2_9BACT|nr:FG-GAP-like repeat-containing protein [Paludisphaera borealis]APW58861.1 hypothetical protein BSF38_00268 [Paludisphaera borealis]
MSRRLIVVWLCLGALGAAVFWVAGAWWFRTAIAAATEDLAAGRAAQATKRLNRLAGLGPLVGFWSSGGRVEVDYWLGVCQEAEGKVDEALQTWRRIPDGSARGANAALRLARLALDHGRFAVAEETLERVAFTPGSPAFDMHEVMLQQVYMFEGRDESLRRRKYVELGSARDAAEVLRRNWLIDESKAFPVDAMKTKLEKAGEEAPDDDRVWLGKANLALRMARPDEADRWITRCLARRPDDPAVWQARLDWAVAVNREPEALEAMGRIPADRLSAVQLERLRIWLAVRRGDAQAEQAATDRVFAIEPGAPGILGRLAELTARAGQTERTAELRRRKAAIDQATDVYRERIGVVVPTDRFAELAEAAETLGRWFEAKGWWTLAIAESSGSLKAREAAARAAARQADSVLKQVKGKTVADLVLGASEALATTTVRPGARPVESSAGVVPTFRDDAKAVGLNAVYNNDPSVLCRLPETMGGGVGLIDYDGDGWLDVYAVDGGSFPKDNEPVASPQRDRLFRNKGDGTFEDVTAKSGLAAFLGGYGHGVTVGDYDGDGRPDLFVTRWRSYALYRNKGDGTFEDATHKAGLEGDRDWPTSAAFADLDNDGDLDLYVCHYSAWDPVTSPPCPNAAKPGAYLYCGPRMFDSKPDHLFRNDGGRFVDVSDQAGITSADREGRGLGVVAADLDGDGRLDLFVANDMTANFLFHNEGDWKFREIGMESGVATNAGGGYLAGMGVACGDLDGDGRLDLAVTNFYGESTTFYQNLGGGQFVDRSAAVGLSAPTRYVLGFGLSFLDVDNDGLLDVVQTNGHVSDLSPHVPYAMPSMLLRGEGGGGCATSRPWPARPGRFRAWAGGLRSAILTTTARSTS